MDALQVILLKKNQKNVHQSKQDYSPKPKRKKRSESLETIFRLPKSVLDKFRPQGESSPLKRERSHNQRMEVTVQLGNIGQEYHQNLRKTILGQTKQILTSRPHRATLQQNNFMFDEPNHSKTITHREEFATQYDKNFKTLKILQKAIIKDDELFQVHQHLLELQANRLPIIRKRQSKRKKLIAAFEQKHHEFSPPHRQPSKQKEYRLQKRDFIPYPNTKKPKDEKMDIRGWDAPDLLQL